MKSIYWLCAIPLLILLTIYTYPTAHQHPWETASKEVQRSSGRETGLIYTMLHSSHKDLSSALLTVNHLTTAAAESINVGTEHIDRTNQSYRDLSNDLLTANQHLTTSAAESRKVETERIDPTNYSQRGGYVLSHDYWEQLTAGSRNLFTLQCWASRLNMSVVEPFVKRSDLHSPTGDKEVKDLLQFSDVYDLDHWNAQSQKANYSPLTPWEHFIERAPRNLITVNLQYYSGPTVVPTPKGELHKQGCKSTGSWNNLVRFLETKHFTVVRRICINYWYRDEFGESDFYREVFGDNRPSDSTVLFAQWRGLHNKRMYITSSECAKPAKMEAAPSKRVILDAQTYTEKHLKTHNYAAIFIRMEKALMTMKQQQGETVATCFHETLDCWSTMVSATGLNTTFLSADIGRFGSKSLQTKKYGVDGPFSEFFEAIYGKTLTIREWEATFESISGASQSGYIAMLQKAIASRAKCVLFVGGGSFQRNALQLYRKTHTKKNWCIHFTKSCTKMES